MKKKVLLVLVIIVNILIWVNSSLPATISSSQSGFVANIIYPLFKWLFDYETSTYLIRKLAHFTEFLILGVLVTLLYNEFKLNKYLLIAFTHGLMVAIIDETIQLFVPGRAGLVSDVLIDLSGVIIGILISYLIINKRKVKTNWFTCIFVQLWYNK